MNDLVDIASAVADLAAEMRRRADGWAWSPDAQRHGYALASQLEVVALALLGMDRVAAAQGVAGPPR